MSVDARHDPDHLQYTASIDGAVAGAAHYVRQHGQIVFTHTVVDPAFEGHGVGSALAKFALDDVRTHQLLLVPQCPFIASYIARHPDYADLVAG